MAENGVAVVALGIGGVFAVAAVESQVFADDVVMRLAGESRQFELAAQVFALHFLQKQYIGFQRLQRFGHAADLHFAVEGRHAFMHIIGGDDNGRRTHKRCVPLTVCSRVAGAAALCYPINIYYISRW